MGDTTRWGPSYQAEVRTFYIHFKGLEKVSGFSAWSVADGSGRAWCMGIFSRLPGRRFFSSDEISA